MTDIRYRIAVEIDRLTEPREPCGDRLEDDERDEVMSTYLAFVSGRAGFPGVVPRCDHLLLFDSPEDAQRFVSVWEETAPRDLTLY